MGELKWHLPYALRQFETDVIIPIRLFGIDVSFTTGSSAKLTAAMFISGYLLLATRERALIPGRLQASGEMAYAFVADTMMRIAGPEAKSSIPLFFTIIVFIFCGTLLGMSPIHETFTAHLIITLALALTVFVHVNVIGFQTHGWSFFRILLPPNLPLFAIPIVVFVELISYLFRPVTLGFRIFANIFAGHVMLKLFADFASMMVTALGPAGAIAALAPVAVMVILYCFEFIIVCIQTYIFLLISSMYLRDALQGH